ncbi:MAG: tRNA pseudouridine(55) synthase TruB [Oscillospiraceae bacterium]|nr:tRNA pseudouridine(55) synthase TruB [Oscillospiraceae bacterium]
MDGILCINKPQGFTSFDVVAKLRGILKMKRIGHAGTLDPMATGVLPVFVGCATKACDILPVNTKAYRAEFELGFVTDTQDSTGKILSTSDKQVTKQEIAGILNRFTGTIQQIPPMYSAVSVNGKRLYELARQGIEVERKPRTITVLSLELENYDEKQRTGTLSIKCSKGTYIRTIIHDIGSILGCGAMMTGLVRTESNGFCLGGCYTIDQVEDYVRDQRISDILIPVERAFETLPEKKLDETQTKAYKNGVKIPVAEAGISDSDADRKYRIYSSDGSFLGLAQVTDGLLRVYKNFIQH